MRLTLDPFRLLLISLAGCLNQQQQDVIAYLQEENRVLREQLGCKRLRLNDDQRRRIIEDESGVGRGGAIQCRQRLGGMLTSYGPKTRMTKLSLAAPCRLPVGWGGLLSSLIRRVNASLYFAAKPSLGPHYEGCRAVDGD
jgi:hypothetical protein